MAQDEKNIYVYENWRGEAPTLLGRLRCGFVRGQETFSFEYDPAWLSSAESSFSLDPDLALYRGRQYVPLNKQLFGLFSDSCPDRWGRLLMKRKEAIDARNDADSMVFQTEKALEEMGVNIDKVVEIHVPDEAITARMSGRRVCEGCGNSYHIQYKPTKVEGICDACGAKVVQRVDDKPETVISRLKTYHEKTAPLKDFYAAKGKLVTVEGQDEISETSKLTLAAIKG